MRYYTKQGCTLVLAYNEPLLWLNWQSAYRCFFYLDQNKYLKRQVFNIQILAGRGHINKKITIFNINLQKCLHLCSKYLR